MEKRKKLQAAININCHNIPIPVSDANCTKMPAAKSHRYNSIQIMIKPTSEKKESEKKSAASKLIEE
jgi:hypothetical protein